MKKPIKIGHQWFSKVGEGFQLEIIGKDEQGNNLESIEYPIMSFFKTNDENKLLVEVNTSKGPLYLNADDLKESIEIAEKDVHCEEWYDEENTEQNDRE